MAIWARCLAAALVTGGALLADVPLHAEETALTLTVYVENDAGVEPAPLEGAKRLVSAVYEAAGVRIVWGHDLRQLSGEAAREAVYLRLLASEASRRKIAAEQIARDVLAQTPRGSRFVYIFTERVRVVAGQYGRPWSTTLGLVMAHEIGHVLLPPDSHSDRGIMRDAIYRQRDDSRLTPAEAALIRQRLREGAR